MQGYATSVRSCTRGSWCHLGVQLTRWSDCVLTIHLWAPRGTRARNDTLSHCALDNETPSQLKNMQAADTAYIHILESAEYLKADKRLMAKSQGRRWGREAR